MQIATADAVYAVKMHFGGARWHTQPFTMPAEAGVWTLRVVLARGSERVVLQRRAIVLC